MPSSSGLCVHYLELLLFQDPSSSYWLGWCVPKQEMRQTNKINVQKCPKKKKTHTCICHLLVGVGTVGMSWLLPHTWPSQVPFTSLAYPLHESLASMSYVYVCLGLFCIRSMRTVPWGHHFSPRNTWVEKKSRGEQKNVYISMHKE